MDDDLRFVEAVPAAVAVRLEAGCVHLWRMRYASAQKRVPLIGLLAAYLGVAESSVALCDETRGKPRLAHPRRGVGAQALEFNWSHSGDYALIALTRGFELGVDIERFGKNLRALEIARRFFDGSEADALAALDPDEREQAFIGLWCAKEAVLKAVGKGLSFGLDRLVFAHGDGVDWRLVRADPMLGDVTAWRLSSFGAAPGYRGALAWQGGPGRILAFEYPHTLRSG